jgi:serine/threonine protein kinase
MQRLLAREKAPGHNLEPGNILLDFDGHLRLADFASCRGVFCKSHPPRVRDDSTKPELGVALTRSYASPKQMRGVMHDKVNVCTFGVILYELLTSVNHFALLAQRGRGGEVTRIIRSSVRTLFPEGAPVVLECILWLCWRREPEECPSHGGVFEAFAQSGWRLFPGADR